MGTLTLRREDGRIVCERCVVADRAHRRFRGLLGRRRLTPGQGMVLRPAFAIHTHFMHFPIDVVFLDSDQVVVAIERNLRPWRPRPSGVPARSWSSPPGSAIDAASRSGTASPGHRGVPRTSARMPQPRSGTIRPSLERAS